MARDTLYNFNFVTPPTISREEYYNVGAGKFILGYIKRAFWGSVLEVWDNAIGGTQLVRDVDYELLDEDTYYSSETGETVYTAVRVINGTYQAGSIYITYKPLGSYVDADAISTVAPVGSIIIWPVNAEIPANWLKCQGNELGRKVYDALYRKIGITYGAGDGLTTFNIPDLDGCFIRQFESGVSDAVGTEQGHALQGHYHESLTGTAFSTNGTGGGSYWIAGGLGFSNNTGEIIDSTHGVVTVSDETRPKNFAMYFIMRVY